MKQRIIGGKLRNKVSDLRGVLKFQEEQIDLLFRIWDRLTNKLEEFAMKWCLVVPAYEFTKNCRQLSNSLGKLAKELSDDNAREKIFSALRQQRKLKKKCDAIQGKLKPARNKVGAHLFTNIDGSFTTWDEYSKILSSISKSDLEKYWSIFKKYFQWLRELVDDLEKEGFVASSPQPKRIHVTTEEIY